MNAGEAPLDVPKLRACRRNGDGCAFERGFAGAIDSWGEVRKGGKTLRVT